MENCSGPLKNDFRFATLTRSANGMITVPYDICNDCELERWNTLSPIRREMVAKSLLQALIASGYDFRTWRIEAHGPTGEQPVLIFTDGCSRLDFALIPGGTLLPGYDTDQLARYRHIYEIVERRDTPLGEKSEEPSWGNEGNEWEPQEERYVPPTPTAKPQPLPLREVVLPRHDPTLDQPTIFASTTPCDLRRKPPVVVAPFLMALTPTLLETAEIRNTISPADWHRRYAELVGDYQPVTFQWQMVAPVLDRYHWELPTSAQWEWAAQGGKSHLFYWGDEIPRFVVNPIRYYADPDEDEAWQEYDQYAREKDAEIDGWWSTEERALITDTVSFEEAMRMSFVPTIPRRFPYANRFGLLGMVSWKQWCAPSDDPDDPAPLIGRGGAAGCFPWQGCQEWMLLLNAVETRLAPDTEYGAWNVLRPVLRLIANA